MTTGEVMAKKNRKDAPDQAASKTAALLHGIAAIVRAIAELVRAFVG